MSIIGEQKNHEVVEMLVSVKSGFGRLPLLIFLLLMPLCACSMNSLGESIEMGTGEAAENAASEEKSPLGSWGAVLPVPEGITDGLGVGAVYRNSEQEIIIQYFCEGGGDWNKRTRRFFNFSQGKLEIDCKDDECSKGFVAGLNKLKEENISFSKYTSFGGGLRSRTSGGQQVSTPMDEGYETLLQNGTVSYEKIIWLSDKKAESLKFNFYALNDNIVLGLADNLPLVVVFKNNLTSPYFKNNKSLVKMDGNLVDSICRVCSADARVNNPEQNIIEAANACFVETINKGVSDDLKKTLEKKIETFYVNKESVDVKHRLAGKWGMFLQLPEEYDSFNLSSVYLNTRQEIVILYSLYAKEDMFWRIFNLSRGILEHEYKKIPDQDSQPWIDEKTAGLNETRSLSLDMREPIGEGFSLSQRSRGSYALQYGEYEVTSPNGDARYEKIIWLSREKHEFRIDPYGDLEAKEINYIHAEAPLLEFYKIDEKTLLAYQGGMYNKNVPIFVIFRNDMTSPYFENNPSLIRVCLWSRLSPKWTAWFPHRRPGFSAEHVTVGLPRH